jgi:hypothetical protein
MPLQIGSSGKTLISGVGEVFGDREILPKVAAFHSVAISLKRALSNKQGVSCNVVGKLDAPPDIKLP